MEIFGGFVVMMSIISLFLAVVWLIMPFVVFAIKGKQDRTLEVLEGIEKRMAVIERTLISVEPLQNRSEVTRDTEPSGDSPSKCPAENNAATIEPVSEKKDPEASPAV